MDTIQEITVESDTSQPDGEVVHNSSTPEDSTPPQTEIIEGEIVGEVPLPPPRKRIPLWVAILTLVSILLVSLLVTLLVLPLLTASATITIVPYTKTLTSTVSLSLPITRTLPEVVLSESQSVPTTGIEHQVAVQATGIVTFYNAAPYPQNILAGTLLVGEDGVRVMTDTTASLLAANPPIESQTSVTAHAINTGVSGNIQALDLNGECCQVNIFVKNLTGFRGGVDARTYRVVSPSDITSTASALTHSFRPQLIHALTKQLNAGEGMLSPTCLSQTLSDRPVGAGGIRVVVTATMSCTSSVYPSTALQDGVVGSMSRALDTHYALVGIPQMNIVQVKKQGEQVILTVNASGHVVYQFSPLRKSQLVHLVAGKSVVQAQSILASQEGVAQSSITLSGFGAMLPANTQNIHIQVLMIGN